MSRYEAKGKKLSRNGHNNNNGPPLPPGITPEIWEQMKQQKRRGPGMMTAAMMPAPVKSTDQPQAPVQRQQRPQQQQQQQPAKQATKATATGAITGAGKAGKGKAVRPSIMIKEANPVAVNANLTDTIELETVSVGAEGGGGHVKSEADEWKTVTRKNARKKNVVGDENAATVNVDKVSSGVNGITIAGAKRGKNKKPAGNGVVNQVVVAGGKGAAAAAAGQQSASVAAKKISGNNNNNNSKLLAASFDRETDSSTHELEVEAGDPAKRLRNLKKRLKEIEQLRQKDKSTLGPDQVEKVKRLTEVKRMIAKLEARVL